MIATLMFDDERSISFLASINARRYGSLVAANSATGLGNPLNVRRNSAPITIAGAFFTPANPFYGGCAWEAFVPAGFLTSRFTNLRTAATHSLGNERGSSSNTLGAPPMHALNPSAIRAYAHRRMALSALRAKSSLSVRLARYNAHMDIVRTLEAAGGCAMNARLITSETDFGPVGPSSDKLSIFKVSEGVCAEHALEKASNLLEVIILSVDDAAAGDSKFDCHYAFLTLHAAESAKAIIDALWATFQIGHEGGVE